MSPAAMSNQNFLWGVSTSAYQIEGAHDQDGRTPSIWDTFSHTPGKVANNDNGDAACDHYHLWESDLDLMAELGVQGYRFSVSWSRFLSNGVKRNPRGIDFYNRLVDGLLKRNIKPFLTLYHWDLPQEFYDDRGGWLNPDVPKYFADYASEVARELGDRVAAIATLNEPLVCSDEGYGRGTHAPGHKSYKEACVAAYHLLKAHGLGIRAMRAIQPKLPLGVVLNMNELVAVSSSSEDEAAWKRFYAYHNELYAHPIFFGRYPENLSSYILENMPPITAEDSKLFSQPLDFLGINYYMRIQIEAGGNPPNFCETPKATLPVTDMGWEIYPEGLKSLLIWVNNTYHPKSLYITENGAGLHETWDGKSKTVADPRRLAYLKSHVRAAWEARESGVPLNGFFCWSFLDNFEWGYGYAKRFGIVYIDYPTNKRIPKESYFLWHDYATGKIKP